MERKKVSLSLKTGSARNKSKESSVGVKTLEVSGQKRGILKEGTSNKVNFSGSPISRSGSYLGTLEKSKVQNNSLDIHCSFETDGSSEHDIDIPCTQPVSHDKVLEDVVAFIEVRSNTENRFEGISKQMEMLGATVVKKLTPEVTHVIFKDGKKTTRERALKKGIHLVSVLWVESCRQSGKRVCEDLFPVVEPGQAVTPLMIGWLKRTKSMQPKAFEEDVQNSADRGERKRKRKLQAENATPTAVVFCPETQDIYSPIPIDPPVTPHLVPDTPGHEISSPLNKTLSYDGDSPKGPTESGKQETDQSSDSSQDIPSSISKLKRRLLKCTPSRLPTPPREQRKTPAAQTRKTPKDVLLTGSEQGKKRKRQDSTKESQSDDSKETASKREKKAKLEGQVLCDSKKSDEPGTNTSNVKKRAKNTPAATKDGKKNASGTFLKDTETTAGTPDSKKSLSSAARKKKTQVKENKKLPTQNISDQNGDGFDSDSGVSIADGNDKPSFANSACSRKKKFSKTAKLVGQVKKKEEFEDSLVTENDARKQRENKDVAKGDVVKKGRKLEQEKPVNQVELENQEKPVNQVDGCKGKDECRVNEKSGLGKGNGGKRNVAKSVRITKEEEQTDEDDADEEETCTEDDEQQCREENERKTERKQRIKLVRKVKPKRSIVMTSMHFNDQDVVLSLVRKLGGFFIEDRVSPSTSHVIAGTPRRTLNVLMSIAQGCWLVSPAWVMKSLEAGYWVDEEPYELSDAFPAAQLCRLERVSAGPGYRQELFNECPPIFVSENCTPPSDSLMTLINLCGGKVCTSVRKAGICIGSMTRRTQAVNITEQWLLGDLSSLNPKLSTSSLLRSYGDQIASLNTQSYLIPTTHSIRQRNEDEKQAQAIESEFGSSKRLSPQQW